MSKRAIKRIVIAVCLIAFIVVVCGLFERYRFDLADGYFYWTNDEVREPNPNLTSDYPSNNVGFYQFNPQTILASLDRGETDVLTPFLGNSDDMTVKYDNIAWTQSDFMRVANALSQKVWHEPLNLNIWGVFFTFFEGQCNAQFGGFYAFEITYYKTVKVGWDVTYVARHIDLTAWNGIAEWAGDGEFSTPFIFGWRNVGLAEVRTTAEQAVCIADENGGKIVWLNNEKTCMVYVDMDKNNRDTGGNWLVHYYNFALQTSFDGFINPLTGEFYSAK
jgi:hypothetical protein